MGSEKTHEIAKEEQIKNKPAGNSGWLILHSLKFVILEYQSVTNIHTNRQQCNGNFGDNTCILILDEGVITANIDYFTEHSFLR